MGSDGVESRLQNTQRLVDQGINPYPAAAYHRTHLISQVLELFSTESTYQTLAAGHHHGDQVRICGRILAQRKQEADLLITLKDSSDPLLVKVTTSYLDTLDPELPPEYAPLTFAALSLLNVGDWIGVMGHPGYSDAGQPIIMALSIVILAKATHPFPVDTFKTETLEIRRRYREKDLALDPDSFKRFVARSRIIQSIRFYLDESGFLEIETPILQPVYGGATAKPFATYPDDLAQHHFLRLAPELYLKRAICGGFERVFELGRVFRNEGIDDAHNPEFTALELYQAYADYFDMLNLTETLISFAAAASGLEVTDIPYQAEHISLERKYTHTTADGYPLPGHHWRIMTLVDAVAEFTEVTFEPFLAAGSSALPQAIQAVTPHLQGIDLQASETQSLGHLLNAVFERCVASQLIQPTFIVDFPQEVSPLAKMHRCKPGFVERFKLYMAGLEFANAFTELNDPTEQRVRFEYQQAQTIAHHPLDADYLDALAFGMPNCGGLGLWIDRLVMVLTNSNSIRDVLLFPTMPTPEAVS